MSAISRRQLLQRGSSASLAGLAMLLPPELLRRPPDRGAADARRKVAGEEQWLVFTRHQAAVVREATARLIPGPYDDPAERGHPGAREADVVRFIDTMLGCLDGSPQRVFAGGPFSNRAGWPVDDMAQFIGLTSSQAYGWRIRLATWRQAYRTGIVALDDLTGGDFTTATATERDRALAENPDGFTTLLFGHAVDGMYSVPEYGGNRGLVGWKDISFPGDVQPRGYTASEVSRSDGPDPYVPEGPGKALVDLIRLSNER
jgi:hypothetical protein